MVNYINVPVPDHLVPAVMTLIAGNMPKQTAPIPKSWTPTELRKLWADSGEPVREFLAALSAVPGAWVPTSTLNKSMTHNKSTTQFAGMMGAFGRRLKNRYGGRLPFEREWDVNAREYQYLMPGEIAAVVSTL